MSTEEKIPNSRRTIAVVGFSAKPDRPSYDVASYPVDEATGIASEHGYHNVEFRLGQIEILPVEGNSVDAIITRCVGFCGIFKLFSGFRFFLLPSRIHAHSHSGNANS